MLQGLVRLGNEESLPFEQLHMTCTYFKHLQAIQASDQLGSMLGSMSHAVLHPSRLLHEAASKRASCFRSKTSSALALRFLPSHCRQDSYINVLQILVALDVTAMRSRRSL